MNLSLDLSEFRRSVGKFNPAEQPVPRLLALYAATIATADDEAMTSAVEQAMKHEVGRQGLYEIVMQSYLFLGFPRMLTAADHLDSLIPSCDASNWSAPESAQPVSKTESELWFNRGMDLCREVYGDNFEKLQDRVTSFAPEVFRWMVIEGYGKVLSRPELPIIERELAIIAFLTVEDRPRQLHSHVKGALNVGTPGELISLTIEDLGPAVGSGYHSANAICRELGIE